MKLNIISVILIYIGIFWAGYKYGHELGVILFLFFLGLAGLMDAKIKALETK